MLPRIKMEPVTCRFYKLIIVLIHTACPQKKDVKTASYDCGLLHCLTQTVDITGTSSAQILIILTGFILAITEWPNSSFLGLPQKGDIFQIQKYHASHRHLEQQKSGSADRYAQKTFFF